MKITSLALAQADPEDPSSPNLAPIVESNGDALQAFKENSKRVSNAKF